METIKVVQNVSGAQPNILHQDADKALHIFTNKDLCV